MEEFGKDRVPTDKAERQWLMRHFAFIFFIGLALVGAGCTPFPDNGSGGAGGATSTTASTDVSTSTGHSTSHGSTSSSAATTSSTSTGMTPEFFSCVGVPDKHFVLKARVDAMQATQALRIGGWIDYPLDPPNPCFQDTGEKGSPMADFDFGAVSTGTIYTTYPGRTSMGSPASCPGIQEGQFLCPQPTNKTDPVQCLIGLELQGCYGAKSVGRLKDDVASEGLEFTANPNGYKVNPTFTTK
jgi:hypothetical protein